MFTPAEYNRFCVEKSYSYFPTNRLSVLLYGSYHTNNMAAFYTTLTIRVDIFSATLVYSYHTHGEKLGR